MNSLVKRILSALVAAFIVLGSGWWGGHLGVFYLSGLMMFLGLKEYASIAYSRSERGFYYSFFILGGLYLSTLVYRPFFIEDSFAIVLIAFVCSVLLIGRNRVDNATLVRELWTGLLGFSYTLYLPGFVLAICLLDQGLFWFYHLLVMVFFGDIFAYFGGKNFGKTPLMPKVSPKKTLEGSAFGLLGSTLTGAGLLYFKFDHLSLIFSLGYPLLTGFVAQNGDLLASLIKRVANVKDSGNLMPGHGGVLDRLDGVYLSAPIVYLFARFGL